MVAIEAVRALALRLARTTDALVFMGFAFPKEDRARVGGVGT